jgi:hypothetical protein
MTSYIDIVDYKLHGIPCQIGITMYEPEEEPTWEHSGYSAQFNWELLDRKGYKAKWLQKKVTQADNDEIYGYLLENYK